MANGQRRMLGKGLALRRFCHRNVAIVSACCCKILLLHLLCVDFQADSIVYRTQLGIDDDKCPSSGQCSHDTITANPF